MAIFQMTAIPAVMAVIAYLTLSSRKSKAKASDTISARIDDKHFRWLGMRLFIPPCAFVFTGALSYAFPRFVMASIGVTLFLTTCYWIILLALFQQRVQSDLKH